MNVIEELGRLQESFFKMIGDLYEGKEYLGPLYDVMFKDVSEIYKSLSKKLLRKAAIEFEQADYELDCREDELLPGRTGFLWLKRNEAADIIYREVVAQATQEFKRRTAALEKLEAALRVAEENARPLDEPTEPGMRESVKQKPKQEQLPGQMMFDDVKSAGLKEE